MMTEINDPEPSELLELNGETVFCQYCRGPLDTDFEQSKEAHWNCHDIIKTESVVREVEPNIIVDIRENLGGTISSPLMTYKPVYLIREANEVVINSVKNKWNLEYEGMHPTANLGISTLRPKHLNTFHSNLEIDNWCCNVPYEKNWFDWINCEINEDYYVVITGVFSTCNNLDITDIAFRANGINLPVQNIQMLNVLQEKILWLAKPFVISPQNNFTVRVYSLKERKQYIGLMGHIIGKTYLLIKE